jgi:hypothetical protein
MTYKMASVTGYGEAARLWMCDARRGARSILLSSYDDAVSALLAEGWEPFGVGTDGAVWFRKTGSSEATGWMPAEAEADANQVQALAADLAPA